MIYSKHYIRLDESNDVIKGFSDSFEKPQDGDICINDQGGRHFELLSEINPSLFGKEGNPLYKWTGEKVIKVKR